MQPLFLLLWIAPWVHADAPAVEPAPTSYTQQKNIVYGETHGVGLVLDVFTPTGKRNGLAIVDVASGSYSSSRERIVRHQGTGLFDALCAKGYTVFAVRPGSLSKFTAPEMLDHVKLGIRWVKSHKDQYAIDPQRLGLMGASAGGHLCTLAAVTADDGKSDSKDPLEKQSSRVKAAAVFFPPTDYLHYGYKQFNAETVHSMPEFVRHLLVPVHQRDSSSDRLFACVEKMCPARQATSSAPPFLFVHGDTDVVVPLQQSERMVAALRDKGVPAELHVLKGYGHGWAAMRLGVPFAVDWMDRRLADPTVGQR